MPIFEKSVTCSCFFRNCTPILTRTEGKKFEDTFLFKIPSKGSSLSDLKSRTIFMKQLVIVKLQREQNVLQRNFYNFFLKVTIVYAIALGYSFNKRVEL